MTREVQSHGRKKKSRRKETRFFSPIPHKRLKTAHLESRSGNDQSDFPDTGSISEPDLDPQDFDAQIQRCKERIKDSITPYIFEIRLKVLKEAKFRRDAIVSRYTGQKLEWKVIQRIELLKALRKELCEKGDVFEEIVNVDAILKAYRSGTIEIDGEITFWSYGKLVSKQAEFRWEDFRFLNEKHQGHKGFWVEGRTSLGLTPVNALKAVSSTDEHGQYVIPLVLRLGHETANKPGISHPEIEFDFIDDTGCGPLKIYADDMAVLQGPRTKGSDSSLPRIMGYEGMKSADGSITYILAIMVEVNIYSTPRPSDSERKLMIPSWVPAVALVDRAKSIGPAGPNDRLSGRWLRHALFTATAPKTDQKLYLSTHKSALVGSGMLPVSDIKESEPMPFVRPNHLAVTTLMPPSRQDSSRKTPQKVDAVARAKYPEPKAAIRYITFKRS